MIFALPKMSNYLEVALKKKPSNRIRKAMDIKLKQY